MSQQTNPVPNQQPAFDENGAPLPDPTQPQETQPYSPQFHETAAEQPVVQRGFDENGAPLQQPVPQEGVDGRVVPAPQQAPSQQAPANQGGNASNPQQIKDPETWATGDQPMTEAQRSYLDSLAKQAGETLPVNLTKAQASEHIDRLQQAQAQQPQQGGTIGADPNGTIGA